MTRQKSMSWTTMTPRSTTPSAARHCDEIVRLRQHPFLSQDLQRAHAEGCRPDAATGHADPDPVVGLRFSGWRKLPVMQPGLFVRGRLLPGLQQPNPANENPCAATAHAGASAAWSPASRRIARARERLAAKAATKSSKPAPVAARALRLPSWVTNTC